MLPFIRKEVKGGEKGRNSIEMRILHFGFLKRGIFFVDGKNLRKSINCKFKEALIQFALVLEVEEYLLDRGTKKTRA